MADPVRVAIVGCGFFARNHLFSWKDLEAEGSVRLVAICDIDAAKAKAAAEEFGVPNWYTDLDAMIEKEQIDLIDIITRMDTHRMLVEKTIARGIATIVQKPFAPTWDDAVAMTKAAEKAGVYLAVHENFRFQTPLLKVAEAVRTAGIGTPTWGRISFRTGYDVYQNQPYFHHEERLIILDLGVHTLDIARVMMGEVEHVYAETQTLNPKNRAEDTATVLLRHVTGAVSVVDFSYESRKLPDTFPETLMEIEGPKGAIVITPGLTMRVNVGDDIRETGIGSPLLHWTSEPWHVAQESVLATCRHLLEAYRAGKAADISAVDNLRTFALAEAAYESAATGRAVRPRAFE